jgi:hypothetical protein
VSRPSAAQRTSQKIPLEYSSTHAERTPQTGCHRRTLYESYVGQPVSNASQEDVVGVPPATNPIWGQQSGTLNALFHLATVLQISTNRSGMYAALWAKRALMPLWTCAGFGDQLEIFCDLPVARILFLLPGG